MVAGLALLSLAQLPPRPGRVRSCCCDSRFLSAAQAAALGAGPGRGRRAGQEPAPLTRAAAGNGDFPGSGAAAPHPTRPVSTGTGAAGLCPARSLRLGRTELSSSPAGPRPSPVASASPSSSVSPTTRWRRRGAPLSPRLLTSEQEGPKAGASLSFSSPCVEARLWAGPGAPGSL